MPGRLGPANGRESTADENVPRPPLVDSSCFMRCRRQAPTGRHANPTFAGGSDDEAARTIRCGQERLPQWGPVQGRAMTETISGGDDSTDAVGSAGPTDMSELLGWHPDFPSGPQRAVSDGLTVTG
jgi:hypothetical protein